MMSESVSSKVQKNWPRKSFQTNEDEGVESAMMCWENLEDSEQEKQTRKTIGRDEDTNNDKEKQNNEEDDKEHIKSTVRTGNQLKIPVKELKLGVDDDSSTLATQETLVKKLVYITNIQEEIKQTINDTRNDGKNSSEYEDKRPTVRTRPLEKSCPINPNENLKDYGGIENNQGRKKSGKRRQRKQKKLYILNSIWMMMKKCNQGMLKMEKQKTKFK